jgi:hypothetical protein
VTEDLVKAQTLTSPRRLLCTGEVAPVNRDNATLDDGAHGVEALVLTGAERAIGYRYGHRVLLRRAVAGLLTRFAAKIEVGPL